MKNLYTSVVTYYKKYKTLTNVLLIALCVFLMLRGCKKTEQPIVLNSNIVKQQETIISNLEKDKLVLKDSIKLYRLLFANSINDNNLLTANHNSTVAQIKELPLDKSCERLQGNFTDTTKLKIIQYNTTLRVLLSPKQVSEVNVCYEDKNYYKASNEVKDYQISTLTKIDIANRAIIKDDSLQLLANNVINAENRQQIDLLSSTNEKLTKKVNRNKFYRNGLLAVLVGVLAVTFVK